MVVRMRHNKSQRNNRRFHLRLGSAVKTKCEKCGQPRLPHRACLNCGAYRNGVSVKIATPKVKKDEVKK